MLFRLLRHSAALGLLFMLVGCASMPERAGPDALARIKKVGVISLAAHDFHRQYTGFTVFGNEYEKHDIAAWKVDEEYEAQMQNALAKLGRFEVVRIPYERKDLYSVYDLSGRWDAPAFRTPKWSAVEEKLKAIAAHNALDAIVLVIRRESGDFLAGTNQSTETRVLPPMPRAYRTVRSHCCGLGLRV